jgi:predicted dinucleotide-binding enzyme
LLDICWSSVGLRARRGAIALPVAGDDDAAKAVVLRLVDELGFDAVDAGGMDESWRQQPGTRSTLRTSTPRRNRTPE